MIMADRYKVLIADDEYWIREKLRTIIDWNQYNIDFLEPAVDGENVLEKIEQNRPDILITDINMPFIDGVDLIKIIKKRYPDMVVFVISGYNDFDFVRTSLLNGAINYLLKPVTKIDLVNTISKALEIISNKRKELQEQNEKKIQLLKASSMIKDRELSMLLENDERMFSLTNIHSKCTDSAGYCLLLIKIHNISELAQEYHQDMNLLSYMIKKEIMEITGYEDLMIFNYIYRSNEFIIITDLEKEELMKAVRTIFSFFTGKIKSPVSIVISEHSYSIEGIHAAYVGNVAMLMTRKFDNSSVIITCDNKDKKLHNEVINHFSEEDVKKLKSLLSYKNQAGIKKLIFETIDLKHCDKNHWTYLEVKQTVKRICNVIVDYIYNGTDLKNITEIENLIDLTSKTVEKLSVKDLCDVLEEMVDFAIDAQKENITGSIRDVVKKAVVYIDNNFFEDLTLLSLANKFCVEKSYFSKIFRQVTGDNLMFYIAKKRIEKAKEYMKDYKINLTEIAFMVGYDDYNYFNRVFRKMTGMSPSDYRNELMKE